MSALSTASDGLSPLRPTLQHLRSLAEEARVRLVLRSLDRVGERPRIDGFPFIENLGTMTMGDDVAIASGPVRSHLVTGPGGLLRIGDRVSIGAGAAIAAESRIEIGDGAHLEPSVMLLDTDYHVAGDRDAAPPATPILIGEGAWLGERVTVLRGATIGRGAHIEAGSVVSGSIPDGALARGVPARVVAPRPGASPQTATLVAGDHPAASGAPAQTATLLTGDHPATSGTPAQTASLSGTPQTATLPAPGETATLGAGQIASLPTPALPVAARIQRIARDVLALPRLPELTDGPATLPAWDSLGTLRLLISIEEDLGVHLPPGSLAGVRDLAGLAELATRSAESPPARSALP